MPVNEKLSEYVGKLVDALLSRRFQIFVGGVLLLLFRTQLGFDTETSRLVTIAVVSIIVGDSLSPMKARRTLP